MWKMRDKKRSEKIGSELRGKTRRIKIYEINKKVRKEKDK